MTMSMSFSFIPPAPLLNEGCDCRYSSSSSSSIPQEPTASDADLPESTTPTSISVPGCGEEAAEFSMMDGNMRHWGARVNAGRIECVLKQFHISLCGVAGRCMSSKPASVFRRYLNTKVTRKQCIAGYIPYLTHVYLEQNQFVCTHSFIFMN